MYKFLQCLLISSFLAQPCLAAGNPEDENVTIKTSSGDIQIRLFSSEAPETVRNFLRYVHAGFYEDTIFHRVIKDFMIQGGGYTADMTNKQAGKPIKNESRNRLHNDRGTVAMARTSNPDSATSQFFINHGNNFRLDWAPGSPGYTVFGEVISGMDVVDAIALTKTKSKDGFEDVPIKPIVIKEIIHTPTESQFTQPIIRNADDSNLIPASSGSGFFVSTQGHVITNHHVVAGCQTVEAVRSGKKYEAHVVAKDNINDLAIIKIDKEIDNPLSVSQMNPELLQDIYVAGYPFGKALGDSIKVTKGIVSSLSGLNNNYSNIQIDAAIQPGNSGGPILDANGNVVGVAVAKLDLKGVVEQYGVVPENTNFGIKSTAVRNLAEANGVRLIQASTQKLAGSELGRKITDGTVYLSCLMTIAQINKLQSSKVVFKHLQN